MNRRVVNLSPHGADHKAQDIRPRTSTAYGNATVGRHALVAYSPSSPKPVLREACHSEWSWKARPGATPPDGGWLGSAPPCRISPSTCKIRCPSRDWKVRKMPSCTHNSATIAANKTAFKFSTNPANVSTTLTSLMNKPPFSYCSQLFCRVIHSWLSSSIALISFGFSSLTDPNFTRHAPHYL
jgi:hypothetical protein